MCILKEGILLHHLNNKSKKENVYIKRRNLFIYDNIDNIYNKLLLINLIIVYYVCIYGLK